MKDEALVIDNPYKINIESKEKRINNEALNMHDVENKNKNSLQFLNSSYSRISNINYCSIDDIIDKGGYNCFTYKAIYLAFFIIFIEGYYLSYFGYILNPFQSY